MNTVKENLKRVPVIGRASVSLYSKLIRAKNRKLIRRNAELKNAFAGRRCFIIATGPSIKTQDLKPLSGELCISVSNFFLHPDFKIIRPQFHLFVASHPPVTEEQYTAYFKDAEKHFPEGQKVLVSITDKHIVDKSSVFKKQNVYYYSLGHKPLNDTIDFSRDLPIIQTSAQTASYLALYLDASALFLLGCDHDWILHVGETRHFYSEKDSSLSQAGYSEWSEDFGRECEAYVKLWDVYRKLKRYTVSRGIAITNCTNGGLLDLFPRRTLESVIKNKTL